MRKEPDTPIIGIRYDRADVDMTTPITDRLSKSAYGTGPALRAPRFRDTGESHYSETPYWRYSDKPGR